MMFLFNTKNDTSIWIIYVVLIQVILSIHNESNNNQCDAFVIISPISKTTSSLSASIASSSSSSLSRLYSSSAKVNENEIVSSSSSQRNNNSSNIIDEYNRVVVKNGIEEETAWRRRHDFEKLVDEETISLSQKDQKQHLLHPVQQKHKQAKVIGPNHVLIYDTTLRGMFFFELKFLLCFFSLVLLFFLFGPIYRKNISIYSFKFHCFLTPCFCIDPIIFNLHFQIVTTTIHDMQQRKQRTNKL